MVARPATARRATRLGDHIGDALGEACRRRGLASVDIVMRWPEIVGADVARHAAPIRLKWPPSRESAEPAVLHLRVESGYAIELQHLAPAVIERVNRYFGWACVGRLSLRQGPLPRPKRQLAVREPDPQETARIRASLGEATNPDLAQSLARLGAFIRTRGTR